MLGDGDVDIGRVELILKTIGPENAVTFLATPGIVELLLQSVPESKRGVVRRWLSETRRVVHRTEETRRESEKRQSPKPQLRYTPLPHRSAMDRLGRPLQQ